MERSGIWSRVAKEMNYMESWVRFKDSNLERSIDPKESSLKITLKKRRSRLRWVSQLMTAGRREWDVQMINSCLYPHDAVEVLKIRLSNRSPEDYVAWHYEMTRIFTVRSAYKLAVQLDQAEKRQTGSSKRPDGSRALCKEIWSAPVPAKVRAFA
jgi:hypothetical protein